VNDSLDSVARSLGMAPAGAVGSVFGHWAELVGDQVAAHTRPVSLRDGVLVVLVDHPTWATQLRFLEQDLRARMAETIGDGTVTRIDVRVRR
jgi:predicted nucleic acid-binding Zn ribbon protein